MAQVTVTINGYAYTVGCDDGQESHLHAMAREVEIHIERIRQIGGQSGEGRLLALASLLMADKIYDMQSGIQSSEQQVSEVELKRLQEENNSLKKQLTRFAKRAESIAEKLKLP